MSESNQALQNIFANEIGALPSQTSSQNLLSIKLLYDMSKADEKGGELGKIASELLNNETFFFKKAATLLKKNKNGIQQQMGGFSVESINTLATLLKNEAAREKVRQALNDDIQQSISGAEDFAKASNTGFSN